MNKITIAGGGVAGLSLGIALAKRGLKVALHDAGFYPRHRVCGEFICGVQPSTVETLGLDFLFANTQTLRSTEWFFNEKPVWSYDLPYPAYGISRYEMDFVMQAEFMRLGGELHTRSKYRDQEETGVVWANGRQVESSPWLGLKAHFSNLTLETDLEMHLGRGAYVGLSRIEDNKVNVCGLFTRQSGVRGRSHELLLAYLRASKLDLLAERLDKAHQWKDSCTGVSSVNFSSKPASTNRFVIGDQYSVIPPFTGNGMSLAIESAAVALPEIIAYAEGNQSWQSCRERAKQRLEKKFAPRLRFAGRLHPFLSSPLAQRCLASWARTPFFPGDWLFRKLH